uniref:Uncharacterized protein n=1 Tax=Rhizophagus irregularis (strain DAOM 181602 / DAOM 197198 / MUCL 43194) TaxID=747089 RepID=U9T013_RHIID
MYMIYEHTVYVRRQDRILLIQCQRCVPTYWLSEIKNCKIPVLQMLVNNLGCLFRIIIVARFPEKNKAYAIRYQKSIFKVSSLLN